MIWKIRWLKLSIKIAHIVDDVTLCMRHTTGRVLPFIDAIKMWDSYHSQEHFSIIQCPCAALVEKYSIAPMLMGIRATKDDCDTRLGWAICFIIRHIVPRTLRAFTALWVFRNLESFNWSVRENIRLSIAQSFQFEETFILWWNPYLK